MLRKAQEISNVLAGLAQNERKIAALYSACAEKWPEDRDFWLMLVAAEEKHAVMIESMSEILMRKPDLFESGRPFNMTAISSSMAWIESNRDKLKKGSLNKEHLLIIARDIEQSILEAKFAEIVRGNDLEYSNLVHEIVADTQAHREMLNQKIRKIRP
jgi:hypothetical protein